MGLSRLILLVIIIGGGIWLWRRFNRRHTIEQHPSTQSMVRCAHCQVHLPQDRALYKSPHWYCSAEHLNHGSPTRG
ncbi:MAG: PP0621 family protein [Pseudomonas sp.]|nr:PP0621 family protein [Pseudomonas sp.]